MSEKPTKHTKVLIIGSGPAGYTAAIYAARAMLKPMLVAGMQPGGQLTITTDVENYPGFAEVIQGPWLMEQMREQAKAVGTDLVEDHIQSVNLKSKPFEAIGDGGQKYTADSIIISTGAQARWLNIESEEKFKGFGVSACATCDGFFFKDQDVAVIGGGNTAAEEALFLTNFASKVYLIHRRDKFRASKIMIDRTMSNPKISVLWNKTIYEILGSQEKGVNGVLLKDTISGESNEEACDGVFMAIGHKPNTDLFSGVLDMDEFGYLKTKDGSTETNLEGIFACGDVQDNVYRQAVTAAGTGCMSAIDAERYLESLKN